MDFLSGFSKRFSSAARSAADRNRESAEAARIAGELREAAEALEQLFAAYGRACYLLRLGEGDRAAADDLVVRIRAAQARIEALETQREAWRAPVRCASCGAMQPREARFCANCGKRLIAEQPAREELPEPGMRYCPGCGAACAPEEKACAVCGALLDGGIGEPAPAFRPDEGLLERIDVEEPAPEEE